MVGTTDISLYDRDKSGKSVVIKTGDVFVLFSYDSKIAEIKYNEEHLKYELLFFNKHIQHLNMLLNFYICLIFLVNIIIEN